MFFYHAATVFELIEKTQGRLEITHLLAELFTQATPTEIDILCNITLGQMNASYKSVQFNMAEKSAIKAVAQLVNVDSEIILDQIKEQGDIGLLLNFYNWDTSTPLTVEHVYIQLKSLEAISGSGSQELKITVLKNILQSLDPVSAKYVIRIVVGKLRLGFSDMTLIDALSWMLVGNKSVRTVIEKAYNICADIGYIARELKKNGIQALEHQKIEIGIPIRPAAAERLPTAKAIFEKLGPCIAQPKLDGFRLQIHVQNTNTFFVHFFSRNLIDMSYMFPDLALKLRNLSIESMVAEGEAISFDPNTKAFLPFQETVKRKRKHGIQEALQEFPLQLFFFDILYLNGQELLSACHAQRRQLLHNILSTSDSTSTLQLVDEKYIDSSDVLEHYFYQTVEVGLEGLVVKRPDALYQPGKRNFNWIKLKRQEEGHLEDTIDCVILGYYVGKGKRSTFGIGAFLVGIYNKNTDFFETVAKIGTGLKDNDWKELKIKIDEYLIDKKPDNVLCAKALEPDVWTMPHTVCLIRADEITLSPIHTAAKTNEKLGYALRFPRVMGFRTDKSVYDVTTSDEIEQLYKNQYTK